jgi:hypothetical protein
MPLTRCNAEELVEVRRLIDGDPLFLWKDLLSEVKPHVSLVEAEEAAHAEKLAATALLPKIPTWEEVDKFSPEEYLKWRKKDYIDMLNSTVTDNVTGMISFIGTGGYPYATAMPNNNHIDDWVLKDTHDRVLLESGNKDAVAAMVLRRFW